MCRDRASQEASLTVDERDSGFQKSMTDVEASEFSAALKFDIAAARIAAISSPEIPCGIRLTINVG